MINCILCGESAIVIGKSSNFIRKIKCKKCGIVGNSKDKKSINTEILVINKNV